MAIQCSVCGRIEGDGAIVDILMTCDRCELRECRAALDSALAGESAALERVAELEARLETLRQAYERCPDGESFCGIAKQSYRKALFIMEGRSQ